ncbi:MAG: zinc finger domain-containing protein, partial [Alteraurantiacibacter sp.]
FEIGILPDRKANDLDEATLRKMHGVMQNTLAAVMDTNADYSQLPDSWLIRHRKEGAECRKCGGTIVKQAVGGRSAYYCDAHQA